MKSVLSAIALLALLSPAAHAAGVVGAWQLTEPDGAVQTLIVTDGQFSVAKYRTDPAKFLSTGGGTWTGEPAGDGEVRFTYEFDTATPERVGTTLNAPLHLEDGQMTIDGVTWTRLDDGSPGALQGAWLITGGKRDGEIRTRRPGARRTMKILSGTRFQWIAYNVDTKEFFGTGGGTYTTEGGQYTENIEFFSRDDARAGLSLPFRYELVDGVWHHEGKSTSGNPMYELWTRREDLGI
ncbi:MAG: membrane or secreted protein [Thermoanaerobaculia bacterium]